MKRLILSATCLSLLFPRSLEAQGVVMGTVREDSSGRPLSAVEILLDGSARRAVTDGSGRYVLERVPLGDHVVLFRLVGFRPVRSAIRLGGTDTVWVNPLLMASAVELPAVEVIAEEKRPRGFGFEAFEERRKMGFGRFIDSTVLRRLENLKVADVLRRYTSIKLAPGPKGELWAEGVRKIGPNGGRCWMQVIADGVVIFRPEWDSGRRPDGIRRPDLNRDFAVSEVEGIEVYQSAAQTPGEFSGTSAACGTIVLWTRRGLKP